MVLIKLVLDILSVHRPIDSVSTLRPILNLPHSSVQVTMQPREEWGMDRLQSLSSDDNFMCRLDLLLNPRDGDDDDGGGQGGC